MRRIGTWTAAAVLGMGLLTGCGGGDTEAYCDGLKDAEQSLADGPEGADGFREYQDTAEQLADDAPDEVSDDWEKVQDATQEMEDRLEDAGLSLDDLSDPEAMQDADPEALQTLGEEIEKISADMEEATDNITEHAKDECDVDLS